MNEWTPPPVRLPKLTKTELLDAIRGGVRDACWDMITNATSMPCADFFDAVTAGVAEGIERAQGQNNPKPPL